MRSREDDDDAIDEAEVDSSIDGVADDNDDADDAGEGESLRTSSTIIARCPAVTV